MTADERETRRQQLIADLTMLGFIFDESFSEWLLSLPDGQTVTVPLTRNAAAEQLDRADRIIAPLLAIYRRGVESKQGAGDWADRELALIGTIAEEIGFLPLQSGREWVDRGEVLSIVANASRNMQARATQQIIASRHKPSNGPSWRSGYVSAPPVQGPIFQPPPDGWFTFGSHVDFNGPLELSTEVGEDGLPLWERHVQGPVDAEAIAAGMERAAQIVEQVQRSHCDIYGGHSFDPKFPDQGWWIEPIATAAAIRAAALVESAAPTTTPEPL